MNDDLISRKAVLGLPRSITRNFFGEIVEESINVKEIEALPSAQPEPTLEQIEEYCHKRCLSIVDNELLHKYAQAEIIRCKDCKHYIPYDWMFSGLSRSSNINNYFPDDMVCLVNDNNYPPDGFCSKAERKNDDVD